MSEPVSNSGGGAESEAGGRPPEGGSSSRNLIQALVSPREAFESIARRPTTALALLVLVVIAVVAVHVAMSRITPESFLASLEASGRELPPEARDDPERIYKFSLWSQAVGVVIFSPLFYFAAAGSFLVLLRLLGSEIGFRQSLSTALHGMLPLGVAALVSIPVALGRDEVTLEEVQYGSLVMSHLGFLASEETGKAMRALLASCDLFSVWSIYLLATGYRIVGRVGAGAAWTAVVALWVVGVLCKVGLAAAF